VNKIKFQSGNVRLIAVIILVVALVGALGYVYSQNSTNKNDNNSNGNTQPPKTPKTNIKFEGRYIDVHTHISPSGMSLAQIIQNMDAEGIDKMVIMKVPANTNDTQAQYGIPTAAEQYPDRFIALYGGEAITMLESTATSGNYSKADEKKFTSLLEQELSSGKYKGIGEIGLRHFVPKKESNATDLTIPGDHPWMFIMSDIAAKYNVPIDVHMEATAETIKGLESLLAYNKNTIIIWDHAGWASTDMPTPQLIGQLMKKYPNLYSSIKMRNDKSTSSSISILDSDKKITSEWMSLFKEYPDRFMVGSDIKAGVRVDEFLYVKDHLKVLGKLPSDILKKIERENAEKIFQIK
jgi:predicted TIM-barrel fold metal-dependent hydrolase